MISDVAALYVDPRGPYPALVEHWWDEKRDARTYEGPWPVVAHPPCGPWSSLKHLHAKAGDLALAPRAVEQVRKWGGALEHPAHSKLFQFCGMPRPGMLPDTFGGRTIELEQVRFGHVARKRTWVYLVGVVDVGPMPPPRAPTHWASGMRPHKRKGRGGFAPPGIKICSPQQRRRTPVEFAKWLLRLASTAKVTPVSYDCLLVAPHNPPHCTESSRR